MTDPLDLVRVDLSNRFVGVPWASSKMQDSFSLYLLQLLQQIGVRVTLHSLFPENAGRVPLEEPAVRLGAIQQLDQPSRQELLRSAWKLANGTEAPDVRFKDWRCEILLETVHRLRKS